MLQRMSADDLTEREDGLIEMLENFCKCIGAKDADEISGARIPGRKKKNHDGNNQQGEELGEEVRPQIAASLELAVLSVENAGDSGGQERREENEAGPYADALGDCGGKKREKGQGHGKAVPDQSGVIRNEVIVSGAQAGERHAEEKHPIGPFFRRRKKTHSWLPGSKEAEKPKETREKETEIRKHIESMRDAPEGALVRKAVVVEGLWNSWGERHKQGGNHRGEADNQNTGVAVPHRGKRILD
jgi:hypothetical protein